VSEVEMAGEELYTIRLKNDFYRDGSYKIYLAMLIAIASLAILSLTSFFLLTIKPSPVKFATDADFRIFPPAPLALPYISEADLIQWVSMVIPNAFTFDFVNYTTELNNVRANFSENGWLKYSDILNTYINANKVTNLKLYITASSDRAPKIIKQNLLDGKYSWWVEVPLSLRFRNNDKSSDTQLMLNVLVSRISTLNDLLGVTIENILVVKNEGSRSRTNE
jgi:intracellular multiplication protein IcmL